MRERSRIVTLNARATKRAAAKILALALRREQRPIILALSGDLGSGKTTFVQGLARALGIRARVQSPTFVLIRWYEVKTRRKRLRHLIHIDAYRLDSAAEAGRLGLRELFRRRDDLIVVEWADRIRKLIPKRARWIEFFHATPPSRRIIRFNA